MATQNFMTALLFFFLSDRRPFPPSHGLTVKL